MRKLFSILAVALFALSAHATVVTHNLELATIASQGSATWESPTITANAWEGIQYWFGDAESAFDASEYESLVLELASASAVGVNYVIYYANGTATNDITIEAGQTSAQLVLKSSKIQKIVVQLTESGTATLSNLYFKGYAGKVSEEVVTINENDDNGYLGNWDKAVKVWSGSLSGLGLQVDDKLVIKYTLSGSDDQFQIKTISNNAFNFASIVNPESGTTSVAFSLNSADITLLTTEGIFINGKNMTITGISVLKHAVLWTGTTEAGNWSGYQQIDASKLTNLQVGNIICVRLSDLTIDGESQVALYDGSWAEFSPGINHVFQEGDVVPMTVEFPVTYKMEQQLRGKNLLVRGKNFTMTDIFIKEGTPTNTVAAYLNVSSAGMATLVLPFDVPNLPDGVQAYNLTNNGDETIWAEEVTSLTADKPVLIIAPEGEYEFVSEEGASDDISSKTGTYSNGALIGTYTSINPLAQQTGDAYNYVLNAGTDGVAFYQVLDESCSVAPYRAYLSCAHNANAGGANLAPRMRIVFRENTTTGVDNIESAKIGGSRKILRNGQLIILRNGVEYNANGQMTK